MNNRSAAAARVEKLRGLEINTVYPGQGRPFPVVELPEKDPECELIVMR
jgi:hypothetical protein